MGVVTTFLTLPLAPVRGVVRLAESLAAIAEEELHGEDAVRAELAALEEAYDAGLLDDDELERRWDDAMERLTTARRGRAQE